MAGAAEACRLMRSATPEPLRAPQIPLSRAMFSCIPHALSARLAVVSEPFAACGGVAGSPFCLQGIFGAWATWQATRQVSMPAMPIIRNVPSFERPRVLPAIPSLPCVPSC